jgi:DNA-binding NarL/FixJ family response regulator
VLTLLLVDFGRLFCECLNAAAPDLRVIGVDTHAGDLRETLRRAAPDVVAIDVAASNGHALRAARAVVEVLPSAKLIVYGIDSTEQTVLHWIEAGAHAYLPRDASLPALRKTVEMITAGEMSAPPEVTFALFVRLAELARAKRKTDVLESLALSTRELDVLRLVARGLGNRDIAAELALSFHTVKNHVQNIFRKIDVNGRMEAVDRARRHGWLDD